MGDVVNPNLSDGLLQRGDFEQVLMAHFEELLSFLVLLQNLSRHDIAIFNLGTDSVTSLFVFCQETFLLRSELLENTFNILTAKFLWVQLCSPLFLIELLELSSGQISK